MHPKRFGKSYLSLKFYELRERRKSDFDSLVEHSVYSNFKMYSVLILFFLFCFAFFLPNVNLHESFFLKFEVLREKSDVYCFFRGAPCIQQFQNTAKPLNSGHLRVFKNLSVIEWCPLLGSNLKSIVTFVTKRFVRYLEDILFSFFALAHP